MSNKSVSLFIEMLDNGFVLNDGNSKKAVETSGKLQDILLDRFKSAIGSINKSGIHNMTINFTVDENVPTAIDR